MDESKEPRFAAWQKWATGVAVACLCLGLAWDWGCDCAPDSRMRWSDGPDLATETRLLMLEERVRQLEGSLPIGAQAPAPAKAGVVR